MTKDQEAKIESIIGKENLEQLKNGQLISHPLFARQFLQFYERNGLGNGGTWTVIGDKIQYSRENYNKDATNGMFTGYYGINEVNFEMVNNKLYVSKRNLSRMDNMGEDKHSQIDSFEDFYFYDNEKLIFNSKRSISGGRTSSHNNDRSIFANIRFWDPKYLIENFNPLNIFSNNVFAFSGENPGCDIQEWQCVRSDKNPNVVRTRKFMRKAKPCPKQYYENGLPVDYYETERIEGVGLVKNEYPLDFIDLQLQQNGLSVASRRIVGEKIGDDRFPYEKPQNSFFVGDNGRTFSTIEAAETSAINEFQNSIRMH